MKYCCVFISRESSVWGGHSIYSSCWDLIEKHKILGSCSLKHVPFYNDLYKQLVCNLDPFLLSNISDQHIPCSHSMTLNKTHTHEQAPALLTLYCHFISIWSNFHWSWWKKNMLLKIYIVSRSEQVIVIQRIYIKNESVLRFYDDAEAEGMTWIKWYNMSISGLLYNATITPAIGVYLCSRGRDQ